MKVSYTCQGCGNEFKVKYHGWYPTVPCKRCGKTARYTDMTGSTLFVKKYKDVVGYGYDKQTGQPMWVDNKGKKIRHDDPGVRYNLQSDPFGWKKTGKKVREP